MNRLNQLFKNRGEKKLFCGFTTLGYPNLTKTKELIRGFEKIGVDILELAYPFSDPLADGPVIQQISEKAIAKGVHFEDAFKVVSSVRKAGCEIPIIFFSYLNPILHYGLDQFVKKASEAGFDGLICPDIPLGVEEGFVKDLREAGVSFIRLLAPNTTLERSKKILKQSDDFVYYVSRKGITGTHKDLTASLEKEIKKLRAVSDQNILIGFGVSNPSQVKRVQSVAEGAIVGSAIVKKLMETNDVKKTLNFTKKLIG